jgi:hypothetical protein
LFMCNEHNHISPFPFPLMVIVILRRYWYCYQDGIESAI